MLGGLNDLVVAWSERAFGSSGAVASEFALMI